MSKKWYRKAESEKRHLYILCQLCGKRISTKFSSQEYCPVCGFSNEQINNSIDFESLARVKGEFPGGERITG